MNDNMKYKIYTFTILIIVLYISYMLCDKIPGKNLHTKRGMFCKNPIPYFLIILLIYFYLLFFK